MLAPHQLFLPKRLFWLLISYSCLSAYAFAQVVVDHAIIPE